MCKELHRESKRVEGSAVRYLIGIDPGDRFIGIAVVGIDENDVAIPVHLAVVDLKGDPHQTDIRKLVKARAEHRRARRTRKAHRRRIAEIRSLLQGIPTDQADRVIALCRRRGWYPDAARQGTSSWEQSAEQEAAAVTEAAEDTLEDVDNASENSMAEIRIPRHEVLEALRRLIPKVAPDLSADVLEEILKILARTSPVKINNRRVGICGMANCKSRRARAADYPVLWVAEAVLNHLQPRDREEARRFFLQQLAAAGWDLRSGSYAAFRCQSPSRRQAAFQAVKEAWHNTKRANKLTDKAVENIDRIVKDMEAQLRRAMRGESSNRLKMCPQHWFDRVKALAAGKTAPQAASSLPGHSVVWEAVEAKIASYLSHHVLPLLPPDATIERVVIERAAFDLMSGSRKGRLPSRDMADQIRWLGPYGQLRFLVSGENSVTKKLLAAETGNLCAVCGEPLGEDIDRAHLLPRELVGGYPYLAIVAAHTKCNQLQGKQVLKVHPQAVEAMRQVRKKLERKYRGVHRWFYAKLGILNALATLPEEKGPPPIERFMQRVFATPEATMQSSDRLGQAIRKAVTEAKRGEPEVVRRAATEVARARQIAVSTGDDMEELEPWFIKELDKQNGSILNHAIDAFVVASLPPAEPRFVSHGEKAYVWEVHQDRELSRLACLQSREAWDQATRTAWYPAPEQPINVMSLTMRRPWRQAYITETRIRQRQGGGAYRQPAQTWLDGLKNHAKDPRGYIGNLEFSPLREVALQALENTQSENVMKEVRAAAVRFLQKQTLAGLARVQPAPTNEHPVRQARIQALRRWAESDNTDQPVPSWVGVTLKKDRRDETGQQKIRVFQGFHNLWNFAMTLFVVAVHQEGTVTFLEVEPDGGLSYLFGRRCLIDAEPLRRSIPVKPITPLAPDIKEWRRIVINMLREAGYVRAWLISRGSVLKTRDGQEILVETKKKDIKASKLRDVVGVMPGRGWLLFQEEKANQRAN